MYGYVKRSVKLYFDVKYIAVERDGQEIMVTQGTPKQAIIGVE